LEIRSTSLKREPLSRGNVFGEGTSLKREPLWRGNAFADGALFPSAFPIGGPSTQTFPPQRGSLSRDGPCAQMVGMDVLRGGTFWRLVASLKTLL